MHTYTLIHSLPTSLFFSSLLHIHLSLYMAPHAYAFISMQ